MCGEGEFVWYFAGGLEKRRRFALELIRACCFLFSRKFMKNSVPDREHLIKSYCMLMYCLGYARGAVQSLLDHETPGITPQHLRQESIQACVAIDLSALTCPVVPFAEIDLSDEDRLQTPEGYSPIISNQTASIV